MKENQVAKSNTLKLQPNSIVQFNVSMHGVKAGQKVNYGSADLALQLLIRRRFADNDGSVEIVKPEKAKSKPQTNEKPSDGKGASKNRKGE